MVSKAVHTAAPEFHRTKPDKSGNFERWSLVLDADGTPLQVSHEHVVANTAGRATEYTWRTIICPTINGFLNGGYDSNAKDELRKLLKGKDVRGKKAKRS
jgi:hypothetical protein